MANPTQQLTVADLEEAKKNIESSAQIGIAGTNDLYVAATCIGIVEELVKSGNGCKYASEQAANLWVIYDKAVAAFGGEVK